MAIKGYWKLNGNSNDYSGNGNNGTDTNITYSQSNGKLNQGAGFNGTSSIINTSSIVFSGQITINAWVKIPSSYMNNNPAVFSIRTVGDTYRFDGLAWHGSLAYKVQFQHYNGSSWVQVQSLSALSVGWHMITYSYNPGTTGGMQISIDGSLNNTVNPHATFSVTAPLSIGANRLLASDYFFSSAIDEVIYDNAIWSPARIKNEYSRIKGFF